MPWKVLVVDDDPAICRLVQALLSSEGYAVRTACDGREALALVGCWRPDLVVLDLRMPVMTGWEVCERLRNEQPDVRVVLMSAESDVAADAARHGARASIAKPFDTEDLVRTVAGLLPLSPLIV